MENIQEIKKTLSFLPKTLVEEIVEFSNLVTIEKETEIVREGQYIKVIPILIKGLVRVFFTLRRQRIVALLCQTRRKLRDVIFGRNERNAEQCCCRYRNRFYHFINSCGQSKNMDLRVQRFQ